MTGRVLVVGDLVTDVVAVTAAEPEPGTDTPARISITGGGGGANTAAWLAFVGRPVTLVTAVGEDAAGTQRVAELRAAGVRCALTRDATATGTVVVIAHNGERTMCCDRGANAALRPDDVDLALREAVDAAHLHLSGYPLFDAVSRPAGRHAMAAARRAGLTVSVDAASAAPLRAVGGERFLDWVRGVDLLFANRDEAAALLADPTGSPEDLALELARHAGIAVIKLAEQGALWACRREVLRVPAVPARVVDVTGAGDAFAAGAVDAWLAGRRPDDILAAATRLGAAAVSQAGGRPPARRRT